LLEQDQIFDAEEIRDLHLFAINYCIRRVNKGQTTFFHDIMDFYKDGLAKGYLLENGVLSRFTYHNIVAAALQTSEFEWVEDFIGRYKNALERSYRDSSYSFNRARLEFKRKRYGEALALLQHSNYYDPLLSLAARTMSLKIYYELQEFNLLEAHLEALKNYIRRKTVLGYHRAHYLNLAKYTEKMISINHRDKQEVETLRQKILAEPNLTEREWLLEQLKISRIE
jgi:tetratricopeptide (TPR) repeat protein